MLLNRRNGVQSFVQFIGAVERMQATWRGEFHFVQDTATNFAELNPLIDKQLEIYNGYMPLDALCGMTPNEIRN